MQKRVFSLGGTEVPVFLRGDGPRKLMLLHGWIADHQLLLSLIEAFDPAQTQVAVFDARGYGVRRSAVGAQTCPAMAQDAVEVATALGWTRFIAVGHSMGAFAAQYMAVLRPDMIEGLALIAPVPPKGAELTAERRAQLVAAMATPESRQALIAANTSGQMEADQVEEILSLSLESTSPASMTRYMESWSDQGFSERVPLCHFPAAVLMGGLDPGAHPDKFAAFYQSWLPAAELHVLPDCGHYLMHQVPDRTAAIVSSLFSVTSATKVAI